MKTLNTSPRLDALLSFLDLHEVDVCAVQETRNSDAEDEVRHGFTIIHAPPSRNGLAGVMLILSPKVKLHNSTIVIPSRLLRASISVHHGKGTHRCVVYAAYLPPRQSPCDQFLDTLSFALRPSDRTRPIFLLADANGHAPSISARTGFVTDNEILNDTRPTFNFNGTASLIDHCFVHMSLSSSIISRLLYQPVRSDHLLVVTTFRASMSPRPKTDTTRIRLDDVAFNGRAKRNLDAAFTVLNVPATAPLSFLPIALRALSKGNRYFTKARPPRLQRTWPSQLSASMAYSFDRTITSQYILSYIETAHRNPWTAWKYVHACTRKPVQLAGDLTADVFWQYFKPGMECHDACPPISVDFSLRPDIRSDAFTLEELQRAVDTMKSHTACGPDDIPVEAFRVPSIQVYLLHHLNTMLDDPTSIPELQHRAYLTPVHKKGDTSVPSNYRPIVLMSVVVKILHKLILLRVRDKLDPLLLPHQAGYRASLSCNCNILPLSQLVETAKANAKFPLYAVFCDFQQAFDSIDRDNLFTLLQHYGIPPKFLRLIRHSHAQQRLVTKFNGTTSQHTISPSRGVMQGDTLAPYLFIICMDYVLRHVPAACGAIVDDYGPPTRIPFLAYADDVVLLANTESDAQSLLTAFESAAHKLGLRLNILPGKTECMLISRKHLPAPQLVTSLGPVKITESYKYLGWLCSKEIHSWKKDLQRRISQAWAVHRRHARIWRAPLPAHLKQHLCHVLITPILSYTALSYPANITALGKLHVAYNELLRASLCTRVHWIQRWRHIHSERLYGNVPIPIAVVTKSMLTQWGHWVRWSIRKSPLPVVEALLGVLTGAHSRSIASFPPSALLFFTSDLDRLTLESLPANRALWKAHTQKRIYALVHWFVTQFILPRRLGNSHCSPTVWEHKVTIWVQKWNLRFAW